MQPARKSGKNYPRKKKRKYSDDDKLIFECEYLNGKIWNAKTYDKETNLIIFELKNGKGIIKEYNYESVLIYEGEYLNGQRNGKGKEYDYDGHKIKFEGEYKNDLRWNGKGYDNNKIVYELKNGNGYVKEYYDNVKLRFEVEYLNGKRNGKGKEYHYNCNIMFKGEYIKGKRWNGKGYDILNNNTYELKEGNGTGKEYDYDNGALIFEGEYKN